MHVLVLGKTSVAEVKVDAFGAAMARAGDVLVEAMIASYSHMKDLIGSSVGCRCRRGLCFLLFGVV